MSPYYLRFRWKVTPLLLTYMLLTYKPLASFIFLYGDRGTSATFFPCYLLGMNLSLSISSGISLNFYHPSWRLWNSEIDNYAYCVCTHDFSLCTHKKFRPVHTMYAVKFSGTPTVFELMRTQIKYL